MGLLTFRLRSARRNIRSWISSILLIALAGSAALLAMQAARRTDTAFARSLTVGNASNAVVSANVLGSNPVETRVLRVKGMQRLDVLDRSPSVAAHGRFGGITIFRMVNGEVDTRLGGASALGLVAYDRVAGRTIESLRLDSGRLADPARVDEVVITPRLADVTGWRVGSHVTDLHEFDVDELDFEIGTPLPGKGTQLSLTVVGIGQMPDELLLPASERVPRVFFTEAFEHRFPDSAFYLNELVRVRPGTAMQTLRADVRAANRAAPEVGMTTAPTDEGLRKVTTANGPLVRGLWIIAVLAAMVGLLLCAQSLGQVLATHADNHAQYRALGAVRRQRFGMELASLLVVAIIAALLAALVGFLLSPLTPLGAARDAEPNPGFSLDVGLTAAVIAVTVVITLIAALPALWRVASDTSIPGPGAADPREQQSHLADLEARSGMSVSAVVGTRFAFTPGRGRSATPVRSVLASLTLVVTAVTATVAFGSNLQHWTTTPRLYGWNWNAAVGQTFGAIPPEFEDAIRHFPDVEGVSALNVGTVTVSGIAIPAFGISRIDGSVVPDVTAGRLPTSKQEIVLGARTMRQLHTHIGEHLDATIGSRQLDLAIVGATTFPAFGNERFGETGLGTGALGIAPLFPVDDPSAPDGRYNYMILRFKPGTATTAVPKLRAALAEGGCADPSCVLTDSRPAEIDGYRNARNLPTAIGVVLLLFIVATLIHALGTTMRRRTRDLAVLRALGCTPRELAATLRWQGFLLTAAALVIGIPIGLVAGGIAWHAFTENIGIAPETVWPIAALAIGAIAMLLIAMVVAAVVGFRASSATRRFRSASSST